MNEKENPGTTGLEIAVIGMAGRFPGAKNINEFWNNLKNGVEAISFCSPEELEKAGFSAEQVEEANFVKAGGLMEDTGYFDAEFFGYMHDEAEVMDPQLRLFHECTWSALEDAGYAPGSYDGLIGLFAGASHNFNWEAYTIVTGKKNKIGSFMSGYLTVKDFLCTLISYKLNLKGPGIIVNSACSTSLVAVHMACQAILNGECDMALAGGTAVSKAGGTGYVFQEGIIHSPDGHCRAFAAAARGTVSGDGVGLVVLKRLEDAVADRDHIYAVVKGSAVNNDGIRKVGYTAPSIEGQVDVIKMAQQVAEVEPESIGYIETHGTGTNLGDPVEMEALKIAFATDKKKYCGIGAVKSNIGHCDTAAGIAGFIKAVLALIHRQIPPTLHFEKPNPGIRLDDSPFYINAALKDWEDNGAVRRAGVSSFGIGGTNAHVILEEWLASGSQGAFLKNRPLDPHKTFAEGGAEVPSHGGVPRSGGVGSSTSDFQLILLSGKSPAALDRNSQNLAAFLKQNPGINLADAAYTLRVGRAHFTHRRMLVASSAAEAAECLESNDPAKVSTFHPAKESPPLVFMFSGQGSQYVNMGRDLYRTEEVFRQVLDRCFEILAPIMGRNLKEILYDNASGSQGALLKNRPLDPRKTFDEGYGSEIPSPGGVPEGRGGLGDPNPGVGARRAVPLNEQRRGEPCVPPPVQSDDRDNEIYQTAITQPLVFAFEYALAKLLMHWGLQPTAMIGHSIGEYVAACLSGVFSLEDALAIVALRGKSMQEMPAGSMLSVPMAEEELMPLLNENLDLAAVNSTSRCVVSGSHGAIDTLAEKLREQGTACRRLKTSHAFHSAMMDPVLDGFTAALAKIETGPPRIPYISNVTGKPVSAEETANPAYWSKHIRSAVRFAGGLSDLLKEEGTIFVEVGPGKALTTFVRQHEDMQAGHFVTELIRGPKEETADDYFLLNRLGRLWLHGQKIDCTRFGDPAKRYRIPLPTYAFEPTRHATGGNVFNLAKKMMAGEASSALERAEMKDWFYVSSWQESDLPAAPPEGEVKKTGWLIFADRRGLAERFAGLLTAKGHEVVMVEAGTQYAKKGDSLFIIDPGRDDHYDVLFNGLSELQYVPRRIVHLWSVTKEKTEEVNLENLDGFLDLGLYSLMSIARAVGRQDISEDIRIDAVGSGVHNVSGKEPVNPAKAAMVGAVKVIPLEYTNIKCRSLDIEPAAVAGKEEGELLQLLFNEIESEIKDVEIAYRDNKRWIRVYESYPIERARVRSRSGTPGGHREVKKSSHENKISTYKSMEGNNSPVDRVKEKGVYLILGGFGGMGFSIAEYLAKNYRARLILLGRTALPGRKEWPQWLESHDEQDETSKKIRKVLECEQQGAEIMTAAADLADAAGMQEIISAAEQRFGRVNGIIHAAGVIDYGGVIRKRTREMTRKYILSKVHGTIVLGQIFKDKQPDFIALFSSIGNVLYQSKFGQVSYNAANEFIEAFADYNALKGKAYTFSVNWCDWKDVGMSVKAMKEYFETLGRTDDYNEALFNAVDPDEGVEAFVRMLSADRVRYTVATYDLDALFEREKAGQNRQGTAEQDISVALRQRPGLSAEYAPPRGELEEKLVRVWETFFHIEKIGVLDDFYELGGDSLRLLNLIDLIKKEMNLTVSMDTMMLYPSIRGLAQSIREETLLSRLECIVKLNKGGNEKNIFIIHPLHGMVYPYRELAGLLEKDFNVYGIQARGMFTNSKLPETMEELVTDYIEQIRAVQAEGPYIIAGYCFGDMVGYKLVKKLEDMNVPVETFIMFDELAFIPLHVLEYYRQQRIIDSLLKPVNTLLDIFRKAKGGEGRGIVEEAGEEPEDNDDNEAGAELSPKKLKIRAKMNINKLNKRYWRGSAFKRTTGIIKSPILAIKAENTHFTVFEEEMARMTLGKMTFVKIPGDHNSIFRYPHVEQLAETIKNNV